MSGVFVPFVITLCPSFVGWGTVFVHDVTMQGLGGRPFFHSIQGAVYATCECWALVGLHCFCFIHSM